MKTFVQPGEKYDFTVAGTAVTAGQGLKVGALVGVIQNSAAVGERAVLVLVGVFDVAKPGSQAWTVGAKIYWDDTAKNFTTTVGTNTFVGHAWAAVGAGAGETTGRVRLHGASI